METEGLLRVIVHSAGIQDSDGAAPGSPHASVGSIFLGSLDGKAFMAKEMMGNTHIEISPLNATIRARFAVLPHFACCRLLGSV